jgi:hypothetical protein
MSTRETRQTMFVVMSPHSRLSTRVAFMCSFGEVSWKSSSGNCGGSHAEGHPMSWSLDCQHRRNRRHRPSYSHMPKTRYPDPADPADPTPQTTIILTQRQNPSTQCYPESSSSDHTAHTQDWPLSTRCT